MNLELFIARRMLRGKQAGSVSVPIVKIAVAGIALGICVMLLSVFIVTGFKQEITDKLSGFMAHLNITAYENKVAYADRPVSAGGDLLADLRGVAGVKQAYAYVDKPAILKSGGEIHGVVLKGVDSLYDASFFRKHIREGECPDFRAVSPVNEILLSASVAKLLGVKTGDRLNAHFVQDPPRVRVFVVKGIYDTGFKEYDDMIALCDMRHLQRLNAWKPEQVSGIGVELERLEDIPRAAEVVNDLLPMDEHSDFYKVVSLYQTAPQIFDWLNMLNANVAVILTLIIIVAGFNMVSGLLIFILDKTSMIGMLKALGYKNVSLKRLFLYIASGMIIRGMVVGNLLAFLLGGLQYFFHFMKLDPVTYYMDTVPVYFNAGYAVLLNVGVLLISVLMLIVPTMLISRIMPIKAIRFE
ncbi:MAG: ABC transporter permease [Odoribacter sp.]|nr:ABC transporter permease [Odoribacter sp.]